MLGEMVSPFLMALKYKALCVVALKCFLKALDLYLVEEGYVATWLTEEAD